jgi:hypothetical protein
MFTLYMSSMNNARRYCLRQTNVNANLRLRKEQALPLGLPCGHSVFLNSQLQNVGKTMFSLLLLDIAINRVRCFLFCIACQTGITTFWIYSKIACVLNLRLSMIF